MYSHYVRVLWKFMENIVKRKFSDAKHWSMNGPDLPKFMKHVNKNSAWNSQVAKLNKQIFKAQYPWTF